MPDSTIIVIIALCAICLIPAIWLMATHNRLVRLRHHCRESWSDIDVELKRRYDLIPNLVSVVKGYAKHERETLERVIELRNQAMNNQGAIDSQASDENLMLSALKQVFALSESYPELKSDRQFLALQEELSVTEDRIAASRRFFNGNVREMSALCEMFPTSIIANSFNFEPPGYFELDDASERNNPRVDLDDKSWDEGRSYKDRRGRRRSRE